MKKFDCLQCGACCRLVGLAEDPNVKKLDRGDLACMHLTDDNLCSIYETRPKECRVAENCPPVLELDEWFRRNEDACGRLHLVVYGTPLPRY